MSVWGAIASIGGGLIGSTIGYLANKDTNKSNQRISENTNESNIAMQRETNEMNYRIQNEINAQNLALQHEAWRREDNAVQRRMADLQASGINPILAAGGAAQASGPINLNAARMEAPQARHVARMNRWQIETDLVERVLRMRDDFATNSATRKVLEASAKEHDARAEQIKQSTSHEFQSFDLRLEQSRRTILEQGERIALLELQQENQRLRNRNQESENIIRSIDAAVHETVAELGVEERQQRIIQLEVENQVMSYDQEKREELGIPSTGSLYEKGYHHLRDLARRAANALGGLRDRFRSDYGEDIMEKALRY